MTDRREVMKVMGMTAIAGLCGVHPTITTGQTAQTGSSAATPYVVPPLTYEYDALEPYIDAQTVHLHHDKHHAAYVKNLNAAVADHPELSKLPVDELIKHLDRVPESVRTTVRNNGGGHANHSFFWQIMQKNSPGQPNAELGKAIDTRFRFSAFQEQFTKAALSAFGSGWAWLSLDDKRQLSVETSPSQGSPWMAGRTPIVGIDVWEHAYYLKYQNVRADYVAAFYKLISWDFANAQYQSAIKR